MKIISYSLFGAEREKEDGWEFLFYMRGFYFNVLMNKLIFPDWKTVVSVDRITADKYYNFFKELNYNYGVFTRINEQPDNLCRSMLWRMRPIFDNSSEIVLCRDADALTSYREAQAVYEWIDSGYPIHSIHDNHAHSVPLMGGLCGFKCNAIREKYGSYDDMISRSPITIDKRGSDQQFLSYVIYNEMKNKMMLHNFLGTNNPCGAVISGDDLKYRIFKEVPGVDKKLWTSNLCSFFIGAAGCNEMETLRFFRDNMKDFGKKDGLLYKIYPKIFYWS